MKKFIIRLSLFIFISLLTLLGILQIQDAIFKKNSQQKFGWISSFNNQNIDCIFLGNSRVSEMINTNLINHQTNLNSLNLGIAGKDFSITYLLLYEFLKKNNVNTVFLQIDPFCINNSNETSKFDFFFYDKLGDTLVFNHLNKRNKKIKLIAYKFFPKTKYIFFNSYYNIDFLFESLKNKSGYNLTTGASAISANKILKDTVFTALTDMDINEHNLYSLEQIINLCSCEGIRLICYTAPVYKYNQFFIYPEADSLLHDIIENHHITYYDFRTIEKLNKPVFFADQVHLNRTGSDVFTTILLDSILNSNQY